MGTYELVRSGEEAAMADLSMCHEETWRVTSTSIFQLVKAAVSCFFIYGRKGIDGIALYQMAA